MNALLVFGSNYLKKEIKMFDGFVVGDIVTKISGKPFKASDKDSPALKYDYIESFSKNQIDPKNRVCAFSRISKTFVNLDHLKKGSENV